MLLLLALAWLDGRRATWLADQGRRDLAGAADEELLPRLRQVADLGEPGVAGLADALCSRRPALAEAAAEVLDEELHRWAALTPAETIGRRIALAEALAACVDWAGPDGRARAADVAAGLLQFPSDARAPACRVGLACERVLEARPVPPGG